MIILSCNNLNKSFGVDSILENASFTINEGDKVGIVGVNGTGKTTLFKIISGEYGYDSGDIYTSKDCEIGYLEQNTNFYSENTILEEVLEVFRPLIEMEENLRQLEIKIAEEGSKSDSKILDKLMDEYSHKMEQFAANNGYGYKSEAKGVLIGLGFKDSDFDKKVDILSGGEKTRVLLGKLLLKKPTLLLLDEPTNHLDLASKEKLDEALMKFDGTLFFVSHDRYFLNKVATKIIELGSEKISVYEGNYDYYLEKKTEADEASEKNIQKEKKTNDYFENKKKQSLIKSLEKKISACEEEILSLDGEIEETDRLLNESGSDLDKCRELFEKLNTLNERQNELYKTFEELENQLETAKEE